jgi:hypothetical protein
MWARMVAKSGIHNPVLKGVAIEATAHAASIGGKTVGDYSAALQETMPGCAP